MKNPLISIVIPVFNDGSYIGRAIESCVNQTFSDIEIVVVDDASTDETPDVVAKYAKADKRIKVLRHDKNKKTLQAIKTGVLATSGKYIMIVSGDDTFELNAVETCVEVINKNPGVDIVHFGRRIIDQDSKELSVILPKKMKLEGNQILKHLFGLYDTTQGSFSNKCWKAELLTKVFNKIKPDEQLIIGEDLMVVFIAVLSAERYVGIKDVIHNYYRSVGMLYKPEVDIAWFKDYRFKIIDSMNELEKELRRMRVDDWVWQHFLALKRQHYASAAVATLRLSNEDRFTVMKDWTERTGITDTLVGVAIYAPDMFLQEYLNFLIEYKPSRIDAKIFADSITSLQGSLSSQIVNVRSNTKNLKSRNDTLVEKNKRLKIENLTLRNEMNSYLGIKRSLRLVMGNIKRKIYGAK